MHILPRFETVIAGLFLLMSLPVYADSAGYEKLFPDGSLEGWKRVGPAHFEMNDHVLHGWGSFDRNSFLVSAQQYRDFDLKLDVRIEQESNSGIQIRSHVVGDRLVGYQLEIDGSKRSWSGGLYHEGGVGWLQSLENNSQGRSAFKVGQWNKYRIQALGPRIRCWVNDVLCADYIDRRDRIGHIAFQVHSGDCQVWWRDAQIRILAEPQSATLKQAQHDLLETPVPGNAQLLFDGSSLSRWGHEDAKPARWKIEDGAMEVMPGTGSLLTREALGGGVLFLEFCVPNTDTNRQGQDRGNSGVYLQGRYEVQVLDSAGLACASNRCGGIYGVAAPAVNMALPPGQWQTYLIEFTPPVYDETGAKKEMAELTVYHNGVRIHDDVSIETNTGAGHQEGPGPAPLLLQDHGHPVQFRNIWFVPDIKVPKPVRS